MKELVALFAALGITAGSAVAETPAKRGEAWLGGLHADISEDLGDGKPLVVQVHVPLCDNNIIRCGKGGLGDGKNPKRNLYWATSGGFVGWFGARRSKWTEVYGEVGEKGSDILEVRVWKRRFRTSRKLEGAAIGKKFDVYVVAYAWRGSAIRDAMDAYTVDLYGGDARVIELEDGTEVRAGGEAQVVSFVGHNGWMDYPDYDFAKVAARTKTKSKRRKGTIAVACITEDYLAGDVADEKRVPLLFTRWLLFAGAHSFEGAVTALAQGKNLAGIRRAAINNYARGQGKKASRVGGAFTNPSDKRWKNL